MTTPLRTFPLASSVPAPPDDGTIREFTACARLDAALEIFWQKHGHPEGPRPTGKQREFVPKKHKVKFKAGKMSPPRNIVPF